MEFEESSIERLKRTLYSRDEKKVPKEKRTPVTGKDIEVPTNWGTNPSLGVANEYMSKRNNSFFNKFLIGSFVFFFIALGVAIFIFLGGMNMISSNNLDIKIVAPSSVSSGEELAIELSIVNGNRTDLEQVAFFVDYPAGASSVGENKPLTRDKMDLGTIPSGGSKNQTVRAVLEGEKEVIKTFNFRIEYKVKGSNATFSKEKTYNVIIDSSPIILNVSYPKEINSGQDVTLNIDIVSNSNMIIKNSLVKVEFPYGFTYKNSNFKPLRDISAQSSDSIWGIGDLKNGDKKTLSITGTLVGQNLENRSFKISVGTRNSGSVADFDVALATNITTVGIRKSFFDLSVAADSVATINRPVPVNIDWQNILSDKILNARVVATLSGNIFDRTRVTVGGGGFYRSVDNTIVWDKNSTDNLASISPGDSGNVSFSVTSLPDSAQTRLIKNPHIDIAVEATGDRSGAESGPISSDENITIKYPSLFVLTSRTLRSIGPLTNTGPIPPTSDKETTYTINWTITNANNDLKDAIVSAVLPAGVEWKNETSPSSERISYNSETRTVSWNIGSISYGTGFTYSPKEVYFKVGITPSVSQIGLVPALMSGLGVTATDTYTETQLSSTIGLVTTEFADPSYRGTDSVVVK